MERAIQGKIETVRLALVTMLAEGHEVSVLDEDPLSHERLDVELGQGWEEAGGRFTIGTALEMDALTEAGRRHSVVPLSFRGPAGRMMTSSKPAARSCSATAR